MKNTIIYLLLISFLLQSCFSYRAIDLKQTQLVIGKKYKIKQEDKFVKATLKTFNDSTATFLVSKSEKQIPIATIEEIKMRNFSVIKTIGFTAGVFGIIAIGFMISLSSSTIGGGGGIQFPN